MKKITVVMLTLVLSIGALMGCGSKEKEDSTAKDTNNSTKTEAKAEEGFSYADLSNVQFTHSSGAGGWYTAMTVDSDGAFTGNYQDSEMGEIDDDAPNGVQYFSEFSGQFSDPKKVDEYTYSVTIEDISYKNEVGTEEVKDGVRYKYSEAAGLEDAKEILFYLPGIAIADLPEGYVSWLNNTEVDTEDKDATLPFYGLYNEKTESGFYSSEYSEDAATIDVELADIESKAAAIDATAKSSDATQMDMNTATGDIYTLWDDELNSIWSRLKEKLDEETMAKLLEEQRAWVADKEKQVASVGADYEGGSMQSMVENDKAAELTKERVYELADYLR